MDDKELLQANIIVLLGLQNVPKERQQAMIERMEDTVQNRITDRINASLSKKQRGEYDKLLDRKASQDQLNAFLTKHVPNLQAIAAEETIRFKREMLEEVNRARDALRDNR